MANRKPNLKRSGATVGRKPRLTRSNAMTKRELSYEKRRVYEGKQARTRSGLHKCDLTKNKQGKIVSRKKSLQGKKNYLANKKKGLMAKPFRK